MTIDEAIKHAEEVADFHEYNVSKYDMNDPFESHITCQDGKYAEEHRQLAEWLKDYKRLLEQKSKIKVLDDMEAAKRLGPVDVYTASAWLKFIKDLKICGLRVCEVTESEVKK